MIQCAACHYTALGPTDMAGHLMAVHGFGKDIAQVEAERIAGVAPAETRTEDEIAFGADTWVYCNQHCKPHQTGWCSVSVRDKVGLGVTTAEEAYDKCRAWGFDLYADREK